MPDSDAPTWDGAIAARYVFAPAWRNKLSSEHEALLLAWAAAQPREADPIEIIAAAFRDGEVKGVLVGRIGRVDFLKRPMVVCGCRLAAGEADEGLGYELLAYGMELLDVWAKRETPAAMGAVATVAIDRFTPLRDRPVWPEPRLMLARIEPDGRQLRLRWFDHARF